MDGHRLPVFLEKFPPARDVLILDGRQTRKQIAQRGIALDFCERAIEIGGVDFVAIVPLPTCGVGHARPSYRTP